MREIQYKDFSFNTHSQNWQRKRLNTCQFELTFKCGLHCRHCYTDCYNNPEYTKEELATDQIKAVLDKMYEAGVLWVCFTGGDPLVRSDFLEIYSYAKEKGFIVTIFTNGFSMTKSIAKFLGKCPPFVIEMTLNAVDKKLYDFISGVEGSFERTMQGIELIQKNNISLKIKTQITQDNFDHIPEIEKFLNKRGLKFEPTITLHARLNGDNNPCRLRLTTEQLRELKSQDESIKDGCMQDKESDEISDPDMLFTCAVGSDDGLSIDPYGNTFPCNLIRNPSCNLLQVDIQTAFIQIFIPFRNKIFKTDSKCKGCKLRQECQWCPGRAFLETTDMEKPIKDYCDMAHLSQGSRNKETVQ